MIYLSMIFKNGEACFCCISPTLPSPLQGEESRGTLMLITESFCLILAIAAERISSPLTGGGKNIKFIYFLVDLNASRALRCSAFNAVASNLASMRNKCAVNRCSSSRVCMKDA